MLEKDMARFCMQTGTVYEESHFHMAIDVFCESLIDAYNEGPDGNKWEVLMDKVKELLPPEVFNDVFKERF